MNLYMNSDQDNYYVSKILRELRDCTADELNEYVDSHVEAMGIYAKSDFSQRSALIDFLEPLNDEAFVVIRVYTNKNSASNLETRLESFDYCLDYIVADLTRHDNVHANDDGIVVDQDDNEIFDPKTDRVASYDNYQYRIVNMEELLTGLEEDELLDVINQL